MSEQGIGGQSKNPTPLRQLIEDKITQPPTEVEATAETSASIQPICGEEYRASGSADVIVIDHLVNERGGIYVVGKSKSTGHSRTVPLYTFSRTHTLIKQREDQSSDEADDTEGENTGTAFDLMGITEGSTIKFGHGGTAKVTIVGKHLMEVELPKGKLKAISVDDLKRLHISVVEKKIVEPALAQELHNSQETKERSIIRNVIFEKIEWKKGKRQRFISNDPSRKQIQIIAQSSIPVVGKPYTVEVMTDTKPEDPARGILFVRIIEEQDSIQNPESEDDILAGVPLADTQRETYERVNGPVPPIEVLEDLRTVLVGDVSLDMAEKRGSLTPDHGRFKDSYTLDERTLEILITIAEAVQTGQSCLLTGETATSKTSAIEYLASLTGHEVIRINLSGQTDTSELIGKYVPNDGRLQIAFEQLLKHPEQLSDQSQEIIQTLKSEIAQTGQARGLNKWESQQIAKFEGLDVPEWRWQDGKVVDAMKRGAWLILDEVNLADPAIRERLNPVLEVPPSIVLTEHEGERIAPLSAEQQEQYEAGALEGLHPIQKGFHIFGTQNSAEYAGRKPMSPAEKRRWLIRKFIPIPDEKQYLANLELLVFGEQPDIMEKDRTGRDKVKYKGEKTGRSMFPLLRDTPNMRQFLGKMAAFHAAVANAAANNEIARSKKEKEIFTRDSLVAFMEYVCNLRLVDRSYRPPKPISFSDDPGTMIERGIETYYLGKMTSTEDRAHVMILLQAANIFDVRGKSMHRFEV